MTEHDGYNPAEMPRRESEHAAPHAPTPATAGIDTSLGVSAAPHARRGQRVSVWVDVIKADKRDAWEHLVHDVIAPAALECDPEVLRHTRLLEPAAANDDGTWTYAIMPDPIDERFDYDATRYVREAFGPGKAAEADRVWDECHATPQYSIDLLQSAW
jgi:hypothetical protein